MTLTLDARQFSGAQQQAYLQSIQAAMGGQGMITAQDQANINAAMQLYQEQAQYPLQQIAIRTNQLAQSPYGQTTTSQGYGQTGTQAGYSPIGTGFSNLANALSGFNYSNPVTAMNNPANTPTWNALAAQMASGPYGGSFVP